MNIFWAIVSSAALTARPVRGPRPFLSPLHKKRARESPRPLSSTLTARHAGARRGTARDLDWTVHAYLGAGPHAALGRRRLADGMQLPRTNLIDHGDIVAQ